MTELSAAQLEALGISRDELIDKIVERCADGVLSSVSWNEDGDEVKRSSDVERRLRDLCQKTIDEKVKAIADAHILPMVKDRIENLSLQETNKWGEKTGAPVTFIEYLVKRADAYLTEPVNYEGKSQSEAGGYSWNKSQSRITHMVHQHLHYSIETAMKNALSQVNAALSGGIQATVKAKIDEIVSSMKINMK